MHKWIVGLNSAGKTVKLYEELNENRTPNTITNLQDVQYQDFDKNRIELISSLSSIENIWDYGDIEISNNTINIKANNDEYNYTPEFLKVITLLCRKGNRLILDEPEFGLYGLEIKQLAQCLELLLPTFKDATIATHCQDLFWVEPENFYWCENCKLVKISEAELYEHIGQF